MTLDEMVAFRSLMDKFIILISHEEKNINSKTEYVRDKAAKVLDDVLPKMRQLTQIYIKKFCNEPAIKSNSVYLSSLRVDVLEKVRKHVDVPLPKTYARLLRTRMK